MKVGPLNEAIRYLNTIHEKRETTERDAGSGGTGYGQSHSKDGERDSEQGGNPEAQEVIEVSDEKVGAAIQTFQLDARTQANGLQAEMAGKGPGLKVVLKDGSGAVIRQFTGEEFLRMREAAKQGTNRGKILDQKI